MSAPQPDKPLQGPVQDELGIPNPSPIPAAIDRGQTVGTLNAQFNYNVSLPTVELPAWEEFSKYSPEVRAFWMEAGKKEQDARHAWIEREQVHRHQYDHNRLTGTFDRQRMGQLLGAFLSCFCITCGTIIMIIGKSPWGFAAIVGGIAPLVGMAIYAKSVGSVRMEAPSSNDSSSSPPSS